MRELLMSIPVVILTAVFATPALALGCTGDCIAYEKEPANFKANAVEPPDPCLKFKERGAHERCVTRRMNMTAVHGGWDSHAAVSSPAAHPDISGMGESKRH